MQDMRPLSYRVISILYTIGTITILMRIYVRWITLDQFGWDDWAMTAMLFFNSIQQGILYFFLKFGGGLHITEVMTKYPTWLPILMKGLLAEEFWYIWMQFSIKMCFLLFFLRLSNAPGFRKALYAVMGFHITTTLVIWLLYALQCIPLAAFYEPAKYPDVKCLDTNVTYFVPYTLNMSTDLFILALPLPVIWNLQMNLKKRLAVLAVITTGGSAVLVSGLRAIILFEFATSPDFTWALGKMVIISNVEMQVAILAANMPSLKAFYTCWRHDSLGRGQGSDLANSWGSRNKKSSAERSGLELDSGSGLAKQHKKKGSKTTDGMGLTLTESEENLFGSHKHAIKITTDYDVQRERADPIGKITNDSGGMRRH